LGIENRIHWVLNAVMHEGRTRNRKDNSACNLSILRHEGSCRMQRDRSTVSLRSKFNLAAGKTSSWSSCFRQFEKMA
jgi:hypothetical protein